MDDTKLDKIESHLSKIDITLAKQQVSLDEHIKRTNLLEDEVERNKAVINKAIGAVDFIKLVGVFAGIAEAIHFFIK